MPKSARKVKKDGLWKRIVVATKFRIGTRKNGTSASLMSNNKLKQVLTDDNLSKYHDNARTVLGSRT